MIKITAYGPWSFRWLLARARLRSVLSRIPTWAWLIAIASLVRLVTLGNEQLWYDEATTDWIVKLPFDRMMAALRGDVHPPLWFFVEAINVRLFGDSVFMFRLPAMLIGVFVVWLVWRLAFTLHFDRQTAFLAGLLIAFMPGALYYSQDARMYPLLTAAVLLATLAAINGSWPVFAVAGIVAVYSHNLGWFYIAAIGMAALCMSPRRWIDGWRGPVYAAAAIGLAYLPWLPSLLHQIQNVGAGYWIQPLSAQRALFPYLSLTMGWRAADVFQLHIYVASLTMSIIALIVCRPWLFDRRGSILLAVIFAPVLIAGISVLWRSIYIDRAVLPACTALVLLWAYALTHLKGQSRQIAQIVIVPALAIGIIAHYFPTHPRQDESQFINAIHADWQADDVVYFVQIGAAGSMTYYLPGMAYATLPEKTNLSQSFSVETRMAMGFHDTPYTDLARQGYKRLWLVCSSNPVISQAELDACTGVRAMYPNRLIAADTAEANNLSYLYLVELKPWTF